MSNVETLKYYTSPKGVYLQKLKDYYYFIYLTFDGVTPTPTWSSNWFFLEGLKEIKEATRIVNVGGGFHRWVLIDESLASDKIPLTLTAEDTEADEDDDWMKYSHLQSLYKAEYAEPTTKIEVVPFEFKCLGELTFEVDTPVPTKIAVMERTGTWSSNDTVAYREIKSLAAWDEVTRMLVPDLLLHNYPCSISSDIMYQIVRACVKDNIDRTEAVITSDYDFCFTVKKKVAIKPISKQQEILTARSKSFKPPRFKTITTTHKEIEIFEMTNLSRKYQGYTVIDGITGSNLKDLSDKLTGYLTELMEYINRPWKECEHCGGTGHHVATSWKLNKLKGAE